MSIFGQNRKSIIQKIYSNLAIILCVLLISSSIVYFTPNAGSKAGGPDSYGYRWIDSNSTGPSVTYNWVDGITGGVALSQNDNDYDGFIPLGFKFPYYSQSFSQISICSNGWASLVHNGYVNPTGSIPSTSDPDGVIAPFWTDLHPGINGDVYYKRNNQTSPKHFVITWNATPYKLAPYQYNQTFQAILYENGSILFQYKSINLTSGINPTIGIENSAGNIGLSYPNILENQSAIWFYYFYEAHDLDMKSISLPSWGKVTDNIKVSGNLQNLGYTDEKNVNISLKVNNVVVNWTGPVINLNAFATTNVQFDWVPGMQGNLTVEIYINPVSGEFITTNNARSKLIDVRYWRGKVMWDRSNCFQNIEYYQTFVTEVRKLNMIVESVSPGTLTSDDLKDYDVYMAVYPYGHYYDSNEIAVLHNFVNAGNGMVMLARSYYPQLTQITSPFEISWSSISYSQSATYTNITPHEITTNVNSVYYNSQYTELVVQGGAKALIYDDDKISPRIKLAISNESTPGRVVCMTDYYSFYDSYINNANNKILAKQVMDWVVGDTSAPKGPSSFKAVNGKLGNQVNLSWNANIERDLVGYYIYRSNISGVHDDPPILVDGSKTSYIDKGPHLVDGTQYFYKMAAIDEVPNISPITGERSATPSDVIPPAIPQNFSVRDVGTGLALNISWNKNKDADLVEYRIYKSDKINFNNQQQFNMTPAKTYYIDTDVVEGTNYYYKLTAVDEVPNESDLPPVKDGTPYDRISPVKPTGLMVTDPGIGNALELSWNHSTDEDLVDYFIERKDTKGNFKNIVVPAPANYYMDTYQLVDGISYSYRLFSRDDSKLKPPNQSPGTSWVSGRPSDITPPTIPFNFTVTDISYSTGLEYIQCLNISWNISNDNDLRGFILYKFDYPQFTLKDERILADLGFANYYLDYDVLQDFTYYYKLVAYDEVPNYSDPSLELTAIPKDVTPSPIPKQFKGEALPQGNAVRLSWALMPETETEGFRLYFKENDTAEFQLLAELGKNDNYYYLHYGLTDDQRYYYKLQSYDNVLPDPNYSPFTSIISMTPSDVLPPAKPSGLSVELVETGRALEIIWVPNAEEDLTGYRVYRSADNLPYTLIIGVDRNTTKVIDIGLVNKKTYRYYVTAIDEVPNESEKSVIKNEIPQDVISPSAPTNVSASISSDKSSIVLTWTPVNESDIMSYLIYRSTDNSNYEKIAEVPFTQKSFEDNDVNPGERYYYRISTSDDGPNYSPRTKPVDINVPDKESGQFSTETQMMIAIGAVILIIIILLLLLIFVLKKKQRVESKKDQDKDKDKVEPSLPMAQPQSQVQVQVQAQTVTPTYTNAVTPSVVTSTPIQLPTMIQSLPSSSSSKITPVTPRLPPASTSTQTDTTPTTTETETVESKAKEEHDEVVEDSWLETPDSTVEPEVVIPVSPAETKVELQPEPEIQPSPEPVQDLLQPVAPIEPEASPKPAPAFIKPISPSKPKPTILIPIDDEQSKIQGIRRRKDRVTITNPDLLDIPKLQLTTPPVGMVVLPEDELKKQQEREQERARMRQQKSKLRIKTKAPVKQERKLSQKQPKQKSASNDDIKDILGKYMGKSKSEKPAEKPKPVMKKPMKTQTSKDDISNLLGKYMGKNEPKEETPKKKKTSEDDIKDLLAQYKN